jgi:hypothetical protein
MTHILLIVKGSINREQSNTPDELSVQAQAAWSAIRKEFVNGMVESSSTRLCAAFALRGQWLNGDWDVIRDLRRDVRSREGIVHAREAQAESHQRFVEGSWEFFVTLSS